MEVMYCYVVGAPLVGRGKAECYIACDSEPVDSSKGARMGIPLLARRSAEQFDSTEDGGTREPSSARRSLLCLAPGECWLAGWASLRWEDERRCSCRGGAASGELGQDGVGHEAVHGLADPVDDVRVVQAALALIRDVILEQARERLDEAARVSGCLHLDGHGEQRHGSSENEGETGVHGGTCAVLRSASRKQDEGGQRRDCTRV